MSKITAIMTGLFPDQETAESAVRALEHEHDVVWLDVTRTPLSESDWDALLERLLQSDAIITTG